MQILILIEYKHLLVNLKHKKKIKEPEGETKKIKT